MTLKLNELHARVTIQTKLELVLSSIEHAVREGGAPGIAVVLDQSGVVKGVITDGDVRRAIAQGASLNTVASQIMFQNPLTILDSDLRNRSYNDYLTEKENRIQATKTQWAILVDHNNCYLDLVDTNDIENRVAQDKKRQIAVYGLGYVGLTLAVSLADTNRYHVLGIDIDIDRIESLKLGRSPFVEKGLDAALEHLIDKNNIDFSTDASDCSGSVHVINVGTPWLVEEQKPDLSAVTDVCRQVGRLLRKGALFVSRSTLPVGATRNLVIPILEAESGLEVGRDFNVVCAPERTIQGDALKEIRSLPQIIGGYSKECIDSATQLFQEISSNIIRVENLEAAELVKLVNNTYRDLTFAFANEVGSICSAYNLNAHELIAHANEGYPRDPIPRPSPGVGGSCLTKDPYIYGWHDYLKNSDEMKIQLGDASRAANANDILKLQNVVGKFCESVSRSKLTKVFILGLSFKGWPETDDLRGSVSAEFYQQLAREGCQVVAYDAVLDRSAIKKHNFNLVDMETGFSNADAVFFLNNHPSHENINIVKYIKTMKHPGLVFDGFGIFERRDIENVDGLYYSTIGYLSIH